MKAEKCKNCYHAIEQDDTLGDWFHIERADTGSGTDMHCFPSEPFTADNRATPYTYRAARDASKSYEKSYADYLDTHTAELVAKGYDVGDRDLGQALAGNDGD